jgi:4-nitrophenol 2-monooxygenase / 4-nitrocatechol 4-monooxygenase, reductase component
MSSATVVSDDPDSEAFRRIVGHLASGVTVITARDGDGLHGMTASSVTSLSLAPPTMLACLNRQAPTARAVISAGRFAINVLGTAQAALAQQFAMPSDDKFRGVDIDSSPEGVPLVGAAHAQIECAVAEAIDVATHTVIIGRVIRARAGGGRPLTYYRGGFGLFQHVEDEEAYRVLRGLIISGEWVDGYRDCDAFAETLGIEPAAAYYALARLSAEGLVGLKPGEGYFVTECSAALAEEAFEARSMIEIGVIQGCLDLAGDEELAALTGPFRAMAALMVDDMFADTRAFMESNFDFHRSVVALAHNSALDGAFQRLHLIQIMARLQGINARSSHAFIDVQHRLMTSLQSRNRDGAVEAVRAYTALARARAWELAAESVTGDRLQEEQA